MSESTQEHPHHRPAWLRPTRGEHRWPAAVAVAGVILVQLALPDRYSVRYSWLLPSIESLLLVILVVADPGRVTRESRVLRMLGLAVVAAASLATTFAVYGLVHDIITGETYGGRLLANGGLIWGTNVIVFALWYWELDRGGPASRANASNTEPDFLFPQMTSPHLAHPEWEPQFADYLYVGFTNATAFSPTDTMPMTRGAKLAMMFQAAISFGVVILVIARAVNVLG